MSVEENLEALSKMSDDDFLAQDFSTPAEAVEPEETDEVVEEEQEAYQEEYTEEVDTDAEVEDEEVTEEEPEEEIGSEVDEDEETGSEDSGQTDFEKKILAPFKANGKSMQVHTAEEAIQLMQMGANYNKKMSGLKDNLKLIKMLENNGLTDTDKLNHLIDISKHDKGAISKLLKDSKLELYDLEDEDGTEYAPNTYNVSNEQLAFEEVIENIRDTDSYAQTIDVISNKWDDSSRQALAKDPNIIAVLNAHIGSGVYKQITDEVERQRMMGTLKANLSDMQAYEVVGAQLYPLEQATEPAQPGNVNYVPPANKNVDPQLKKRKKALSSPKASKAKQVVTEVDFSKLSDEEILAL